LQWTVFASSKSYIKALEYAALGIPVIASDAEPYRDFVVHGVTGFLVRRDHEWLSYLRELASDDGLRQSMGPVRMVADRTGGRYDGQDWPVPPGEFDVPDAEAQSLIEHGDAVAVAQPKPAAKAATAAGKAKAPGG
jgi:hypothetical protein